MPPLGGILAGHLLCLREAYTRSRSMPPSSARRWPLMKALWPAHAIPSPPRTGFLLCSSDLGPRRQQIDLVAPIEGPITASEAPRACWGAVST